MIALEMHLVVTLTYTVITIFGELSCLPSPLMIKTLALGTFFAMRRIKNVC